MFLIKQQLIVKINLAYRTIEYYQDYVDVNVEYCNSVKSVKYSLYANTIDQATCSVVNKKMKSKVCNQVNILVLQKLHGEYWVFQYMKEIQ